LSLSAITATSACSAKVQAHIKHTWLLCQDFDRKNSSTLRWRFSPYETVSTGKGQILKMTFIEEGTEMGARPTP
jgi:hypothetical protein